MEDGLECTSTYPIRFAIREDVWRLAVLGTQVWLDAYAVDGISEVIAKYVLEAFAIERIERLVRDPDAVVLAAERGPNLAGYVVLRFGSCHGDISAEIETLYVQEALTERGIGSALLERARAVAMDRTGSRAVWLAVNSRNEGAIRFYRARGLTPDGITYFDLGGTKHENTVMVARD